VDTLSVFLLAQGEQNADTVMARLLAFIDAADFRGVETIC
jgi:hypothetical protein